jgi:hypothetical protein
VGICRVNTFFNPVACCFLYKAKDLSASRRIKNAAFWNMAPYRLVEFYPFFGGSFYFHLQGVCRNFGGTSADPQCTLGHVNA